MQRGQWSEVTAIASRDLEKARAAAAKLGIPKAYGSYEELLADADIDAIYNPLPNHLHVPWTIKAAERGKHVLCEKPIALSADEARQLMAVRDRTGAKIQEAFMVRTHPQWLTVKELVASGRIGEVRSILGRLQLHQSRPGEHPQPARARRRRADGHRLLSRQHVAVHLRPRAAARHRRHRARPRDGHRSADLDPARLRHGARGRHLQHADGALSAAADLRDHRPHRAADSLQRAPRSAPAASSSTPARTSSAAGSRTSTSTSATSTRSRAISSRRRSSTTTDVPLPLEDAVKNMACIDAIFKSAETGRWEVPQ